MESGSFSYRIAEIEGTARMGDVVVCPPGFPFHRSVIHALSFHFIGFSLDSVSNDEFGLNAREHTVQQQLSESVYKMVIQHRNRLADNLNSL
ncbi:hypothetical protein AB4Z29_05300 [Paenibacillus sp. 2TAB23]|uniref:hypothetical protein n=1 Tax=Paenibacillus sp. 2TAB23 TaxID=3233004 RepID=UPI003F975E19